MSSLNRVMLIGNLGRDPEIRSTGDGRRIANLNLATSETWKDKNSGEKRERTEWHRIVIFNENLVGIVEKYCRKGSKIYIDGALQTRKWTDQQNQERYSTEIVLAAFNGSIVLLDRAEGGSRPPPASGPDDYGYSAPNGGGSDLPYSARHDNPSAVAAARPASGRGSDLDDDIPF